MIYYVEINKKRKRQNHRHSSKTTIQYRLGGVIWPVLESSWGRKSSFIVWG